MPHPAAENEVGEEGDGVREDEDFHISYPVKFHAIWNFPRPRVQLGQGQNGGLVGTPRATVRRANGYGGTEAVPYSSTKSSSIRSLSVFTVRPRRRV